MFASSRMPCHLHFAGLPLSPHAYKSLVALTSFLPFLSRKKSVHELANYDSCVSECASTSLRSLAPLLLWLLKN